VNTSRDQPKRFDWAAIRKRMDDSLAALAEPNAADKAKILQARAKALSREVQRDRPLQQFVEVLEFMLAYERYALDTAFVREAHPLKDITALPGTPAYVAGIVNVRGQIVSVIDLKRFFDLPSRGLTDLNKVIILDDGQTSFGLLVDAVVRVHRLELDAIQSTPPTLSGVRSNYLLGVTAQHTIILDALRILSDPNIVSN
jgi:purine-binding chemotaxis protein CheW